jgi:hypothetical protein
VKKYLEKKKDINTLASAAGLTLPAQKKAPPSITTLLTFFAKLESLFIAYKIGIMLCLL